MDGGRCSVAGGALVPTVGDNGRISPSPSAANLASKAGSLASGASTASLTSLDQVCRGRLPAGGPAALPAYARF